MNVWCAKAEQLKQKADLLFPNDPIARDSYADISACITRVDKMIKSKSITGVAIIIAAIVFLFIRNGTFDSIKVANTPVDIPETELSVLIPQIEGGKGKVGFYDSDSFSVIYYGISKSEFEAYKTECKNRGFTIDCKNTESLFDAFNEDGCNICVSYYSSSSKMNIEVSAAREMRSIVWPNSKAADVLPRPKSDYGIVSKSKEDHLSVYIGNMTIDEYAEYVNECIRQGFIKDMYQSDVHYEAYNANGYSISVDYERFNTIFIRIEKKEK